MVRCGVKAPQFLACSEVVAGDETASRRGIERDLGVGIGAARPAVAGADQHLVLHDQRAAVVRALRFVVIGYDIPDLLAGFDIQRDNVHVDCAHDELVAADREAALGPIEAWQRGIIIRKIPGKAPEHGAGLRIQSINRLAEVPQEHDSVVNDRRGLIDGPGARIHAVCPGNLEILHARAIDLVQRAVAPTVLCAPPVEPVAWRRIAQHLFGNRRQFVERREHGGKRGLRIRRIDRSRRSLSVGLNRRSGLRVHLHGRGRLTRRDATYERQGGQHGQMRTDVTRGFQLERFRQLHQSVSSYLTRTARWGSLVSTTGSRSGGRETGRKK